MMGSVSGEGQENEKGKEDAKPIPSVGVVVLISSVD